MSAQCPTRASEQAAIPATFAPGAALRAALSATLSAALGAALSAALLLATPAQTEAAASPARPVPVYVRLTVRQTRASRAPRPPRGRGWPAGQLTAAPLRAAIRTSLRLRLIRPRAWRVAPVDLAVCRAGCRVVEIRVRLAPASRAKDAVRAEIRVFALPGLRRLARARIQMPAPTAAAVVADALVLKAALLLDAAATPPAAPVAASAQPRRAPAAPSTPPPAQRRRPGHRPSRLPPRREPAKTLGAQPAPPRPGPGTTGLHLALRHQTRSRDHARLFLGAGSSMQTGLDQSYTSYGATTSASLRLLGPWRLRLEVGYQDAGGVDSPGTRFRALPITLATGLQASWRWWTLGLYAGGTALFHWVDLTAWGPTETRTRQIIGLTGGPTILATIGVRPLSWLTLSLGIRFTYLVTRLQTELTAPEGDTARFSAPKALLHPSFEISFRL